MFAHHRLNLALLRGLGLWVALAAAGAGLATLTVPAVGSLLGGHGATFDQLIVAVCGVAATASLGVLLVVTSRVVVDLALARAHGRLPSASGGLRRLVLAACGVAVVAAGLPAAAHARVPAPHGSHGIAGLPLPDRSSGGEPRLTRHEPAPAADRRVHVGDSLWAIARDELGDDARPAALAAYALMIYRRNLTTIGPDPDLIRPGQLLRLPSTQER